MSLITRCPVCGTAFRTQSAQLSARGGTVRCGKCGSLFDGVAALVEEGAEQLALEPSPQLGLFDPSRRQPAAARAAQSEGPLPEFMAEAAPPRRWLWGLLALLAAAALLAQLYRFRGEATMYFPELRPTLEALCRSAGCEVPLPQRPRLMSILSSDMHTEPQRDGVVVLNVLLRNTARFAQQYPALELTLTYDAKAVTRRLLAPREYLDNRRAAQQIAQGMEAGGEETLRLYLDTRAVKANGYRLCIYQRDCLE